ncbi:hypothetical protein [Marinicellulosiphila megalodicopiae]|uniref:hypothetical protein n=1 Tax=Marinicellulosiphila megalodicopiae TaxID=2724896 RepID=UPI003BB17B97
MLKQGQLNNTHRKMLKVSRILSLLSSGFILAALVFLHLAKPEWQTGVMTYKGVFASQNWSQIGLFIALPLSFVSSILLSFVWLFRYIEYDRKDSPLFVHFLMCVLSWSVFGIVLTILYKAWF